MAKEKFYKTVLVYPAVASGMAAMVQPQVLENYSNKAQTK